MPRVRLSMATAFAVLTFMCCMAALSNLIRVSLLGGGGEEKPPEFLFFQIAIGGGFVTMGAAVGSYFLYRLIQVRECRAWPRTTAVVLPPPKPPWRPHSAEGTRFFRVRFEFEIDGRCHRSWLWTTRYYEPGEELPLAYQAHDPEQFCFDPGGDTHGAVNVTLYMLVFGGCGFALLFL